MSLPSERDIATSDPSKFSLQSTLEASVDYWSLPAELIHSKRWLVWSERVDGHRAKPSKVPFYANGRTRVAPLDSPFDQANLACFGDAVAALRSGRYSGLGFALGPDGTGNFWQGIDLDDVEANGLCAIAAELPGYVEVSPSGKGLHAIGYGARFRCLGSNQTGIEAYCEGRFFTITARRVRTALTCLAEVVVQRLKPLHEITRPFDDWGDFIQPEGEALTQLESDLRGALAWFNPDEYHEWIDNGQRLRGLTWGGMKLWLDWSAKSSKFNYEEAQTKWHSFAGTRTSYAAIFAEAQRRGWINSPKGYWTNVPVTPAVRAFCARLAESMRGQ